MIRSLIFDFDGLVIDTELPDFLSWAETFEAHGCSLPLSTWAPYIGRPSGSFDPYAHLEEQLGRPIDRDALRAPRRRRYLELVEAQPILPGVAEYIADAERLGLRLAVASSSSRQWVSGHLSRLGLSEQFDCIRCADDVRQAKPYPDVYNSVLDALLTCRASGGAGAGGLPKWGRGCQAGRALLCCRAQLPDTPASLERG